MLKRKRKKRYYSKRRLARYSMLSYVQKKRYVDPLTKKGAKKAKTEELPKRETRSRKETSDEEYEEVEEVESPKTEEAPPTPTVTRKSTRTAALQR